MHDIRRFAVYFFVTVLLTASVYTQETSYYISVSDAASVRKKLVATVLNYVGTPYKYGGLSASGIDCSGLIFVSVRDATGQNVPRMVKNIFKVAQTIPKSELQPGDIVFFDTAGPLSHAGIYIGAAPDGSCRDAFVHSVSSGSHTGVKVTSLSSSYWKKRFVACGRILPPSAAVAKNSGTAPKKSSPAVSTAESVPAASWDEFRDAEKQRAAESAEHDKKGAAATSDAWNSRAQKKY